MNVSTITIAIGVTVCIIWEQLWPYITFKDMRPSYLTNTLWALLNLAVTSLSINLVYIWVFSNEYSIFIPQQVQNTWWFWILSFLILDLFIYSWHRFFAHSPVGFIFHRIHHSDTEMNALSAYRFHTLEVLASQILRIPVLILFSIPEQVFVIYTIVFSLQNIIQHSNIKLPQVIDRVCGYMFITPDMHKIHHSVEQGDSHTNFGTVLSLWDRIFSSLRYYTIDADTFQFGIFNESKKITPD